MRKRCTSCLPTILLLAFFLISCRNTEYSPKPRMYPRIMYPEYQLQKFEESYCPFTFQYPDYWKIIKDTSFFGEKPEHECWYNLEISCFQGSIHCSFSEIGNKDDLSKLIKDAFKLAREHQIKANYIDELAFTKADRVFGMLYNIEGPTASPFQFYLTDSTKHFLRGSLYFNSTPRPDSLMPIAEFVKRDIMTMLNSFQWMD